MRRDVYALFIGLLSSLVGVNKVLLFLLVFFKLSEESVFIRGVLCLSRSV